MLALLLLILGIQYTTLQSILGILGGILGIFGYFGDFFFGYTGIPLPPLADPVVSCIGACFSMTRKNFCLIVATEVPSRDRGIHVQTFQNHCDTVLLSE